MADTLVATLLKSTVVASSDSVYHNRVQVFRIPVLLLVCSQDWTRNLQKKICLQISYIWYINV